MGFWIPPDTGSVPTIAFQWGFNFLDDDMIILPKSAAKVLTGGATSGQPVGNQLQLAASWSPTGCQLVDTEQKNRENIGVVDINFFWKSLTII